MIELPEDIKDTYVYHMLQDIAFWTNPGNTPNASNILKKSVEASASRIFNAGYDMAKKEVEEAK